MATRTVDVAIVGAGMAGASLAAEIGDRAKVLLIEAESQPGFHSTGRSAAFWMESYGGPVVQPLTSASHDWLDGHGLLRRRGVLHVADAASRRALDELAATFAASGVVMDPVTPAEIAVRVPGLSPAIEAGLWEPGCADIDVARLHQHYLASARRAGVDLLRAAPVRAIARDGGAWRIAAGGDTILADVLVDAAGAWASDVAALAGAWPIAITPHRRTLVQLVVDPAPDPDMPVVAEAGGRFYWKPEAGGRLWLSPHDETPVAAHDVQPEEFDVATAIDRLERATDWRVVKVERAWAGLRSFAPDRAPVYGYDPTCPGFFWCAGQGGFGIQTAPAAAMLAASLLLGAVAGEMVAGIDARSYAPDRFLDVRSP